MTIFPVPETGLRKLGARGLTLFLFGSVFAIIGVDVLLDPFDNPDLIYTRLPVWLRVLIWSGAGLFALVVFRWNRWQPAAFGLLTIGPVIRSAAFFWAVAGGDWDRLPGALVWLLVSVVLPLLGIVTAPRPPSVVVLPQGVDYLRQRHPEWLIETQAKS